MVTPGKSQRQNNQRRQRKQTLLNENPTSIPTYIRRFIIIHLKRIDSTKNLFPASIHKGRLYKREIVCPL